MIRYAALCIGVLVSVNGQFTEEEKREIEKNLQPLMMKCLDEVGVPPQEIEAFKKSSNPSDIDPCFLSCMMREKGMIDDDGMFDSEASFDLISKVVKNEKTLQTLKEIGETCLKVNKEDVTDGKKGCERALLLAECLKEHNSHLGYA